MKRIRFHAMGSEITVLLESTAAEAPTWLQAVPGWFEAWEQALSRFRPSSELNYLNNAGGRPVKVSDPLWQVLQQAQLAWRFSGGMVMPTLLAPLQAAGYTQSFEESITWKSNSSTPFEYNFASLDDIQMDSRNQTVCLPPGTGLDLGGIAKGWAAWQAAMRLSAAGAALVNAGGDIAISDSLPGGQLWPVGVNAPYNRQESLEVILVGKGGVATSGRDRRRWQSNGHWRHHIIDPRTGQPAQTDVVSATVIAPDTMQAETAAKTILLLGSQAGLEWLENHPSLAGLVAREDGAILTTPNFQNFSGNKYEQY